MMASSLSTRQRCALRGLSLEFLVPPRIPTLSKGMHYARGGSYFSASTRRRGSVPAAL